jgi:hypothetical protein
MTISIYALKNKHQEDNIPISSKCTLIIKNQRGHFLIMSLMDYIVQFRCLMNMSKVLSSRIIKSSQLQYGNGFNDKV